jgi:predicted MPP superfamily phosphohydrolase
MRQNYAQNPKHTQILSRFLEAENGRGREVNMYFIAGLVLGAGIIVVIHILSALIYDRKIEYREVTFSSDKVGADQDGYTFAFISDLHRCSQKKLSGIMEHVWASGADVLLLGGDLGNSKNMERRMAAMAAADLPDGVYGVPGNHDAVKSLRAAAQAHNVNLLENRGVHVSGNIYLAGLADLKKGRPDVERALAGAGKDDFILLLGHNPELCLFCDISGADMMICGHNHGGEVTFFGMWAPMLTTLRRSGQRFMTGWCQSPTGDIVYVGNGIGSHFPFRVYARPQVIYLTLRSK